MTTTGAGGGTGKGPSPARPPAFDDAAITAARHYAREVWDTESARERDRLLALPLAERLVALDDEDVRAALTPEHRIELRASIATAAGGSPVQDATRQQHDEEMAAWRARDTAARAAMDRLDGARWLAAWVLAPVGAVLPVTLAAVAYGWGPLHLMAVLPQLFSLPTLLLWGLLGNIVTASLCAFLAARARRVSLAWGTAAIAAAAGLSLLVVARALPLYIAGIGVRTNTGQSLAGVLVRVDPNATGARLEVLRGAGDIRRGEVLDFSGADPVRFLRGR